MEIIYNNISKTFIHVFIQLPLNHQIFPHSTIECFHGGLGLAELSEGPGIVTHIHGR